MGEIFPPTQCLLNRIFRKVMFHWRNADLCYFFLNTWRKWDIREVRFSRTFWAPAILRRLWEIWGAWFIQLVELLPHRWRADLRGACSPKFYRANTVVGQCQATDGGEHYFQGKPWSAVVPHHHVTPTWLTELLSAKENLLQWLFPTHSIFVAYPRDTGLPNSCTLYPRSVFLLCLNCWVFSR